MIFSKIFGLFIKMAVIAEHKKKTTDRGQFWGIRNCPRCWSTKGFKFHYGLNGDKMMYPNECLNCGCFCNVYGEVYHG